MNRRLDRGSAPVEFVLVGVLLVAVALSVLQVAFVAHIRAVAVDSAIAGAAHAALADTNDAEGVQRTIDLIERGIASTLLRQVTVAEDAIEGRAVVVITVSMGVPMIGPWLSISDMAAHGRAFREDP